jgi:hypothetical protein
MNARSDSNQAVVEYHTLLAEMAEQVSAMVNEDTDGDEDTIPEPSGPDEEDR